MYNIFLQEEVHGSCELWESTGAEFCWSKHGKSWSERSVDKWKTLWQGKMKMGFSYPRSKMFWGPVSWTTKPYLFSIYWYQIHLLNHIQNMSNVKKVPNIHFFGWCLPKMWPHLEIPPLKWIQFYSLKSHR